MLFTCADACPHHSRYIQAEKIVAKLYNSITLTDHHERFTIPLQREKETCQRAKARRVAETGLDVSSQPHC